MTTGERIKQTRLDKNMTQTELAARVGITKQAIYKYENGIVTNIPFERIEQIATALNVSVAQIIGTETRSKEEIDEIAQWAASLENIDEKSRRRFVYALSQLNENGWELIARVAQALYDEQMEENAQKEKEQHNTAERSVHNAHKKD